MNKLHVYTGDGKGKTSAAMGLALRALGHGWSILITQFLKTGDSGELQALAHFPNAHILTPPSLHKFTFQMNDSEKAEAILQQTMFAQNLTEIIKTEKPQLIVLDELGIALSLQMIDVSAAATLIDAALQSGETVITGRTVPEWLQEKADYLSWITAKKHPYKTEGLSAREGIEY